MRLSNCP